MAIRTPATRRRSRFHPAAGDASYAPVIDAGAMMANELLATQVMQALARGDKVAAVKLVREAGIGSLREAMQYVEAQAVTRNPALKDELQRAAQGIAAGHERHGLRSHASNATEALRAHNRRPTVEMGDAPGGLRWVMLVLGLLALSVWWAFGA